MIFFKNPFNTWGKSQIHPLSPKKNVNNVKTVTSAHKGAMCCLSGLPLLYFSPVVETVYINLTVSTSSGRDGMNVDEEDFSMNGSSGSLKYENKDLKTKWKLTIFYFVIFISSVFC